MNQIRHTLSATAMKRMPGYFRILRSLLVEGKLRVTSRELSEQTGFSVSQIRLDLQLFPNVGQRGYGYSVRELYTNIANCLGAGSGYRAVCIGKDHRPEWLESICGRCGVRLVGTVDDEAGQAAISDAIREKEAEIGIILPDCKRPWEILDGLLAGGVKGVLNYADFSLFHPELAVRNCSLSDPLLSITGELLATGQREPE